MVGLARRFRLARRAQLVDFAGWYSACCCPPHNTMTSRVRLLRNAYWLFLGLVALALISPMALLNAQSVNQGNTKPLAVPPQAPAPVVDNPRPDFEKADRNRDGFIDKSESGVVPGLSALFERVDRNKDGKLDRDEFGRGLTVVGQK